MRLNLMSILKGFPRVPALLLALLAVPVARGGTFTVTNTDDSGAGSLREAVGLANAGGSGATHTIVFDTTVFASARTITLSAANGAIGIGVNLTLRGSIAGVTVSGGDQTGLFQIAAGTVDLRNITLANAGGGSAVQISGGSVMLAGCTLRDNTVVDSVKGGAVANAGGAVSLVNCTLARNKARGTGGGGGAIYQSAGTLSVLNCTITQNNAGPNDGGGLLIGGGAVSIGNSIVAGNSATAAQDVGGAFTSLGFNLIGIAGGFTPATGDQVNVDPGLDLTGLSSNGGPTQTISLMTGSPAIDKGKAWGGVTTDQRGLARTSDLSAIANAAGGDGSDIGAYELSATVSDIAVEFDGNDLVSGVGTIDAGPQEVFSTTDFVFTLRNKSGAVLTLNGTPKIAVSGANAAEFTVGTQPPGTLAGDGVATFTVRFVPVSLGPKSAAIALASDDSDEGTFTVALAGSAIETLTLPPVIDSPGNDGAVFPMANIAYTLPEEPLAGSVTITFNDGVQSYPFAISGQDSAGAHQVTLDATSLPEGAYTIALSYRDAVGHAAATAVSTNVRIRPVNPRIKNIIAQGTPAPGRGTNQLPEDAVLASFNTPATDTEGDLAFVARWTSENGKVKGSGLFLNDQCLAVTDGDAYVAGGNNAQWKSFTDPVVDDGRVACIATMKGVPAATATAVLCNLTSPALQKVARAGETGTEDGARFKSFKAVAVVEDDVVLLGQLAPGTGTAPKTTAANDMGIWVTDDVDPRSSTHASIIREGMLVDGNTVKTITAFVPGRGSPGCGRGYTIEPTDFGEPQIFVRAMFTDPKKKQGFFFEDADGDELEALSFAGTTGIKAPLIAGSVTATFASYGLPARNGAETAVFLGSLTPDKTKGINPVNAVGIFIGPRAGGYFVPVARIGDAAGGTGAKFIQFKDPVLSEDDAVAFQATIKGGAVQGVATQTIWWTPPGQSLQLLAQGGARPGPDLPAEARWLSFTSLAIAGGGRGPIFVATLVPGKGGVPATGSSGVWACDFTGTPRLLFRTGVKDAIIPGKTLKSFSLLKATVGNTGVTRSFNNVGSVVWLAAFTDQTQALVTTEVP